MTNAENRVESDGEWAVFYCEAYGIIGQYEIPLYDLSGGMFARWVAHLCEKRWVTKEHLSDLAIIVRDFNAQRQGGEG